MVPIADIIICPAAHAPARSRKLVLVDANWPGSPAIMRLRADTEHAIGSDQAPGASVARSTLGANCSQAVPR